MTRAATPRGCKRIGVGEPVLVGDGRGCVRDVRGDGGRHRRPAAAVSRDARVVPPPDPRIVVVQALPKGERAELAVEMLTELGVDEIVPWQAARSIAQWHGARADKALERWRRTAREAAKQSRRAWLPQVGRAGVHGGRRGRWSRGAAALVLHEDADGAARAALPLPVRRRRRGRRARRAGSRRTSSPRSTRPARRRCGWAPRCCAPRPREPPRWPRCPLGAAGADWPPAFGVRAPRCTPAWRHS